MAQKSFCYELSQKAKSETFLPASEILLQKKKKRDEIYSGGSFECSWEEDHLGLNTKF